MREQFAPLVDKECRQFLNDQVNDRLKNALGGGAYVRGVGVFDEQKVETRVAIDRVEDIYLHAELLRQTVTRYLGAPGEPSAA